MFGFVISLVVQIWMAIIQKALTRPVEPKAGKVDLPRAEEGDAIPAVFGTVLIAPNMIWWGNVEPKPIKGDRRISAFGVDIQGPRATIGHRYYVGMQGALCWGPVDELVEIVVAETNKLSERGAETSRLVSGGGYTTTTSDACSPALPIAYVAAGQAITVTANDLFGGKTEEGGVSGTLRFYYGSTTQTANSYLTTNVQSPFPAYRGLCYAVWEKMYLGTSPYIKPWQFVVRRCPGALGVLAADTSLSRIGDDANPAEVIYDIWTDSRWGLGESASALDLDSFLSCLQTLSDEGLGISGAIADGSAEDAIKEILRTIDGVLCEDPLTGKMRLKLIRADYTVADLEVFNASNSSELEATRADWDKVTTEVKVSYTDASKNFTTRTRAAYNPAARAALGKSRGISVSYPLISTGANAEAIGLRDLRAVSSPLAAGSITVPRIGITKSVGDPFVIDYPDNGLPETVVRVTRARYGKKVDIDWAQDVFGATGGVFISEPPDSWTPPTPTDAGRKFDVQAEFTVSETQGCLTLTIEGDVSSITLVETQTQKGGESASGWTTQDNSAPITVCVDRDDTETGHVAYRISYTDGDGVTQTLDDDFPVPPLLPPDALDPGIPTGEPANQALTWHTTPAVVVRNVGAALVEPEAARPSRRYLNTTFVGAMRAQLANWYAAPNVQFHFIYSLDSGTSWNEAGPFAELDLVKFPKVGDAAVLADDSIGANVLFSWGLKGGDGTQTVKVGNIYSQGTSSETQPDPPSDSGAPQGGPLGNLLLDLNAFTLLDNGVVDGATVDTWNDDSGNGNHAVSYASGREGKFKTAGIDGGKPSVRFTLADSSTMRFPIPSSNAFTLYFVLDNIVIHASTPNGNYTGAAALITNSVGSSSASFGTAMRPDGRISYGVGENALVTTTASKLTNNSWDDGAKHVHAFVRNPLGGLFHYWVDGDDEHPGGENSTGAGLTANPYCYIACEDFVGYPSGFDCGRVLWYDQAHDAAQIAIVTDFLRDQWGTP